MFKITAHKGIDILKEASSCKWGPKKPRNYLLEGRPLEVQAFPLCECLRNPSLSVYQLVLLWDAALSFSEFFLETQCICPFHDGDLWMHLPMWFMNHAEWVFSSFWPKMAWPPCPTLLPIYPISLQATFLFPRMKEVLKGKCFADVEQGTVEALKGIKTDKFKNCFEQWKKHLDRCIVSNEEYFEGEWKRKNTQFFIKKFHFGGIPPHIQE